MLGHKYGETKFIQEFLIKTRNQRQLFLTSSDFTRVATSHILGIFLTDTDNLVNQDFIFTLQRQTAENALGHELRLAHAAWLGCEFRSTIGARLLYSQLIEAMRLLPQSFDMRATFPPPEFACGISATPPPGMLIGSFRKSLPHLLPRQAFSFLVSPKTASQRQGELRLAPIVHRIERRERYPEQSNAFGGWKDW